jgi:Carboxypeptidase regulatory-like domain
MKDELVRVERTNKWWVVALVAFALIFTTTAFAQSSKKGADAKERTVQGMVQDADGKPVPGAIVQLKNTRTQQIRSFIAKDNGEYFFNGLSSEVDYELRADANNTSSATKTLSSFDGRKQAVLNLKLNK